ncbi:MAG: hypothetical protein GXX91_12785 [Verrucomicrobiaceae bacterium]|nr:hypothetical protein [Verrucomicrobiaceae bacterium]
MMWEKIRRDALRLPRTQRAKLIRDLSNSLVDEKKENRTEEAVALSILHSGCLWWWTHIQFVTAVFFGLPFLRPDVIGVLWFYVPAPGWPVNVPTLFFCITVLGVVTLFLAMPMILSGSRAKWRQILLMSLFSLIALGFSFYIFASEDAHYENALKTYEQYQQETDPSRREQMKRSMAPLAEVLNAYLAAK